MQKNSLQKAQKKLQDDVPPPPQIPFQRSNSYASQKEQEANALNNRSLFIQDQIHEQPPPPIMPESLQNSERSNKKRAIDDDFLDFDYIDEDEEREIIQGKQKNVLNHKRSLNQQKDAILGDRQKDYLDEFYVDSKENDAVVDIQNLDEKEILRRQNEIEAERLLQLIEQSRTAEERYLGLMEKESLSIFKTALKKKKYHEEVRKLQVQSTYRIMEIQNTLSTIFKREQAVLESNLDDQQVRMEIQPHDLTDRREKHVFSGVRDRFFKCSWKLAPQPIEVMIRRVRCPKDKIPSGEYVLTCNILDRFAGNKIIIQREQTDSSINAVLPMNNNKMLKQRQQTGIKMRHPNTNTNIGGIGGDFDSDQEIVDLQSAIHHRNRQQNNQNDKMRFEVLKFKPDDFRKVNCVNTQGDIAYQSNYDSNDIIFNSSVKLLGPSQVEIRPSNVLVFELIKKNGSGLSQMGGSMYQIHGWGVLPLINSSADVLQGKFKIPMMLGELDKSFDKFSDFEHAYSRNIDEWLGNCYVEIRKINPRAVFEGWETNLLHNLELKQERIQKGKKRVKRNKFNKIDDLSDSNSNHSGDSVDGIKPSPSQSKIEDDSRVQINGNTHNIIQNEGAFSRKKEANTVTGKYLGDYIDEQFGKSPSSDTLPSSGKSEDQVQNGKESARPSFQKDIDFGDDDLQGKDGNFDDYYQKQRGAIFKARSSSVGKRKMKFIMDEILIDLGFNNRKSSQFVMSLIITLFALYIRIFMHYLGQYALLQIASVPIIKTSMSFYNIKFEYIQNKFYIEILVLALGNLMNTFVFAFMMLVAFLFAKLKLKLPNLISSFFSAYGIATFFDWILVSIVDIATVAGQYGDIYRLYWYYQETDSAGIVGLFITLIIFFFVTIINAFLIYNYLVFVHKNGKMLDLFIRISQEEQKTYFFLPGDSEVSAKYMHWQLEKAKHYKYEQDAEKRVVIDEISTFQNFKYRLIKFYNNTEFQRLFIKLSQGTIQQIDIGMMRKGKINDYKLDPLRQIHQIIKQSGENQEDQNEDWSEHAQQESGRSGEQIEEDEEDSRAGDMDDIEIPENFD